MRAVKGKDKVVCFISGTEAKVYEMIAADQLTDINNINERDMYFAEEMYKRNAVRKVRRGQFIGYKTYDQNDKIQ